jgi:hypothetical protein
MFVHYVKQNLKLGLASLGLEHLTSESWVSGFVPGLPYKVL